MRLVDADAGVDALQRMAQNCRNFGMHNTAVCYDMLVSLLGDTGHFPTINAVPYEVLPGVCKHGQIACVDSDNRVYDRVCRKNNPHSWDICCPETCPLIDEKEDAPCE